MAEKSVSISEILLDAYRYPRHRVDYPKHVDYPKSGVGQFYGEVASIEHKAIATNPRCGDLISVVTILTDEQLRYGFEATGSPLPFNWSGKGCILSLAVTELLVRFLNDSFSFSNQESILLTVEKNLLVGMSIKEPEDSIDLGELASVLLDIGKFPVKAHCAELGCKAIRKLISGLRSLLIKSN